MEVLILTNSFDGTSDIISKILKEKKIPFIRWNIDLWENYEISFNKDFFEIRDSVNNKVSSKNKLKVLWRKPFIDYLDFKKNLKLSKDDKSYARNEIKNILASILAITRTNSKLNFIDPLDEYKTPKLYQLKLAKKYFKIPNYEFSILNSKRMIKNSIAKPLGNSEVGKKILYTTRVDQKKVFRPYPWFFQQAIDRGTDVTCVYICGNIYFYECDFKRNKKSIDWRKEINTKNQSKWHKLEHKKLKYLKNQTKKFMQNLKLNYGRLDFIKKKNNFYFLECNPNGQFGWLDDIKKFTLHKKFVDSFLKF